MDTLSARAKLVERLADVRAAFVTLPGARTWGRCLVVYAAFVACALPIGFAAGLLKPGLAHLPPEMLAVLPSLLLLHPALVEEVIFRALLLPRDPARVSRRRLVAVSALALAAFVAWHPVNAWLFRPAAADLLANPAFLVCVALLGIACTVAYLISRSLWPPVLLHWITVAVWLILLGGLELAGIRR